MLLVAAFFYLCITVYTSFRITQSTLLTSGQKSMNILINFLMPLLWYFLIKPVIFRKHKLMTKEERDRMTRMDTGSRVEDSAQSSRDARFL